MYKNIIKILSICLALFVGATIYSSTDIPPKPGDNSGAENLYNQEAVDQAVDQAEWTNPPSEEPPKENTKPPINTSAFSQYKSGALGIEGILNAYSNLIVNGKVRIGTTEEPTEKLEVQGNIKASGTVCDSNGCIGDGGNKNCEIIGDGNTAGNSSGTGKLAYKKTAEISCPNGKKMIDVTFNSSASCVQPTVWNDNEFKVKNKWCNAAVFYTMYARCCE